MKKTVKHQETILYLVKNTTIHVTSQNTTEILTELRQPSVPTLNARGFRSPRASAERTTSPPGEQGQGADQTVWPSGFFVGPITPQLYPMHP